MMFIDNFTNDPGYCFGWGWYLSNDMQIYIITPFLLIFYFKNNKFGLIVIATLFFGCLISGFIITYVDEYGFAFPSPHKNS